jgi:cell division protein FtsW (lipid II flippase)
MFQLSENTALRSFVRTWSIILAASCAGMAIVVLVVLWVMNGFHGLGIEPVTGIALILGSIGATALCVCLMGLLFYSDSSGKDEAINHQATSQGD